MSTDTPTNPLERLGSWARHEHERYAGDEDRPLGSYLGLMAVYAGGVAAASVAVRASRRTLPERVAPGDLLLLTLGTHKLARLVAKDPITSPIRAPFTEYDEPGGPSEVMEEVRGEGVRHAVGEMLACPFCLSQWIATTGMFGLVVAPRPTRFVASVFSVLAGADFLQLAYAWAQQRTS